MADAEPASFAKRYRKIAISWRVSVWLPLNLPLEPCVIPTFASHRISFAANVPRLTSLNFA